MAVELVAGAFLSSLFDYLFQKMESPDVVGFFMAHRLDDRLLKKLKITMITVSGLLDSAEEKQITVPAVKRWLDELKEAAFEADDLLDEIAYEELRSKLEGIFPKVSKFFSPRNPFQKAVNEKLQEILVKVECLITQMQALGLTLREGIGEKPSSLKIPTTSLPDYMSGVYGRDEEKRDILNALLSHNISGVGMICIVGTGGMGKTTLARLVYNDSKVRDMFDLKLWVYASESFDVSKVTRDILGQLITLETSNANLQELQDKVQENLQGKKFLLVLDDVWSDRDDEWENLLKPLKDGAQGSKIVVTTRNVNVAVATKMHIDLSCNLEGLRQDHCWSVLARHAFDDEDGSEYPELVEIGKEIAERCQGLPLAAKSIGSILRFKRKVAEWRRILESNMWDVVGEAGLAALKLSYYYLPSHIKQCVAYCAIFPKGFEFKREFLIHLWMAEGFLDQCNGNKAVLEDWGNEYINYLVSRSFFQRANSDGSSFIIHDLIHELCEFVSGEFCFSLKPDHSFRVPMKTRYLSALDTHNTDYNEFEGVNGGQLLRTFIYVNNASIYVKGLSHDFLLRFKRLRVLSLENGCTLHKLPKSIGNLNHLRYLNLHNTKIARLPESVCSLYNLQILILWCCWGLFELPTNMCRLINLCYLDIRNTNLRRMPEKMNKLKKLHTLTNFILGKRRGFSIKELRELNQLRGELTIENLQHVVDDLDALSANLKDIPLTKLRLIWSGKSKNQRKAHYVLHFLKPHQELESLFIDGFEGAIFPYWLGNLSDFHPYFSKLVCLNLSCCQNCLCLPPLGQLASLKELSIRKFGKIKTVGFEFHGSCTPPEKSFPSLQILRFEEMEQWYEWEDVAGAFPCLKELYIEKCPNLRKTLPSELPSLTKLYMWSCLRFQHMFPKVSAKCKMTLVEDSHTMKLVQSSSRQYLSVGKSVEFLIDVADKLDALEAIEFKNSASLDFFPLQLFRKTKRLCISGCPNLVSFSAAEGTSEYLISPFQEIFVFGDTKLSILPLLKAQNIRTVRLHDYVYDVYFSKLPDRLYRLEVNHLQSSGIPKTCLTGDVASAVKEISIMVGFEFFPSFELFPELKSLRICSAARIKIPLEDKARHGEFISLDALTINDCTDLVIFPEEGLFAPSLTRLVLLGCYNLKSLPECMQSLFPSLLNLEISQCPALESFPTRFLPTNLQFLHIQECHKLFSLSMFFEDVENPISSSLTSVVIRNLHNLTSLSYGVLQHLAYLEIGDCPKLHSISQCVPSRLASLDFLKIYNCPELESFLKEGLPSKFRSLYIQNCNKVVYDLKQSDLRVLQHFTELTISGYNYVESFPEETLLPLTLTFLKFLHLQNLKTLCCRGLIHLTELVIGDCPKLEYMPECMKSILPSLMSLTIYRCQELNSFLKGGLPSRLQRLKVWDCDKLVTGLVHYNLQELPSLLQLKIGGYHGVKSLEEKMLLPSTLTSLNLWNFASVETIGLQHLTSLRRLTIGNCPRLQCWLVEELSSSISFLRIYGCPLLRERFSREDWSKIPHIPQIRWQ